LKLKKKFFLFEAGIGKKVLYIGSQVFFHAAKVTDKTA
jgi:hypothetical protein